MTLSLNEIEVTAKKATRGAGYPWGLAEEAAKATRWLCAHDLDGCVALAALLDQVDNTNLAGYAPKSTELEWEPADTALCPLIAGAALSDRANKIADHGVKLGTTIQPLILIHFAGLVAQQIKSTVTVRMQGAEASTDGSNVALDGTPPDTTSWVVVGRFGQIEIPTQLRDRAAPNPNAWAALNSFANRTYAPATEESRMKGAGAGLSDND